MMMNVHSTFTIVILWLLAKIPMAPTIVFVMKVLLAMAMTALLDCSSIMLTPATKCTSHSRCCTARAAEWQATSDAEHAVSNDAHGPCIPSTKDIRPEAIERLAPVDAYTLRPAGVPISTLPNSLAHCPTLTPTTPPSSAALVSRAPCSAA